MAQAHQDSSFELAFVPLSGSGDAAPTGRVEEIPMLHLDSTEPLPSFLSEQPVVRSPLAPRAEVGSPSGTNTPGSMWLQGDVLMCACPDCHAPMSVRLWLMIADCWKCRTSIELSEEQEREARRLLREREEQARGKGAKGQRGTGTNGQKADSRQPTAEPVERPVATSPPSPPHPLTSSPPQLTTPSPQPRRSSGRRSAARRHVGVRAKIRKMAVVGGVRVWINEFFRNMPAWLVSLVFHVVLLIILNLLLMSEEERPPEILLSTVVDHRHQEGGDTEAKLVDAEAMKYDLPVSAEDLKDPAKREVLIKENQEAKQLRLDPNDPAPDLPPLDVVRNVLRSNDTVRRSFAARDPRMRVEVVTAEGGTTQSEAAVARALRWLASQQNEDGGWGRTLGGSDAAGTSLALLPFLGAGQTHQSGIYQDQVSMGLRWLIKNQTEDGDLRHTLRSSNPGMYAHGQAAIVLSEAYALTGDEQLRGPAQKAIDFIAAAQHVGGGWRYQPGMEGDTSVLGWQLMALHSAKVSGLNVPETTLELSSNYLDTVQSNAGARYYYNPHARQGNQRSEAMSAEGLLCRMYTGWDKSNPALEEGLNFLIDESMPHKDRPNIYYWYYGTQAAHHMGGDAWDDWNLRMREILVNSQEREGKFAGAWRPAGPHAEGNDWIYMTSLATCCLEVYYRHAPLFRQIELDNRPQ